MNTFISPPGNLDLDPPFVTPEERADPLNFLELGSGTGIVAACCMDHFGDTNMSLIVTDLPEVCPLLEGNLARYLAPAREARATPTLRVCPLAWGNYDQARDAISCLRESSLASPCLSHIICSDLVSWPSGYPRTVLGRWRLQSIFLALPMDANTNYLPRSTFPSCSLRCCAHCSISRVLRLYSPRIPLDLPKSSFHTKHAVSRRSPRFGRLLGYGSRSSLCYHEI